MPLSIYHSDPLLDYFMFYLYHLAAPGNCGIKDSPKTSKAFVVSNISLFFSCTQRMGNTLFGGSGNRERENARITERENARITERERIAREAPTNRRSNQNLHFLFSLAFSPLFFLRSQDTPELVGRSFVCNLYCLPASNGGMFPHRVCLIQRVENRPFASEYKNELCSHCPFPTQGTRWRQ